MAGAVSREAARAIPVWPGRAFIIMSKLHAARPTGTERKKPRTGVFEFFAQVRSEGEKVTWPSRKETVITTAMVFVMVVVASVFFLVADFVLQKAVGLILGIGG
jgi:preprotein translocase subunit SecE